MNKVFLIGNLTRDPELSETNNGMAVCNFSIAVNRDYTNADGERVTDFFNITVWRTRHCRRSGPADGGGKCAAPAKR